MKRDEFDAADKGELREAEALARALEEEGGNNELALLAEELRAAWNPAPIEKRANEVLVLRALRKSRSAPKVSRLVAFTGAAAFAAASLAIFISSRLMDDRAMVVMPPPELLRASTTEGLFKEAYDASRGSERIDRIARARSADYRENRFRGWGLR